VRALVANLIELGGAALLVYGVARLSTTAALILGGVLLISAGAVYGTQR
jgi:hypothetical protein